MPENSLIPPILFLPTIGFKGINVTIPHKTSLISLVDNLTDRAALIGAVNTVHYNTDGNITGDNTDAYGFIENIKQVEPNWDPILSIVPGSESEGPPHLLYPLKPAQLRPWGTHVLSQGDFPPGCERTFLKLI